MSTYFVTGATGTIGSETVKALLASGENVIAASRHPEKAKELFGDQVEAVSFDFSDSSQFDLAKNADGVFLLGPPMVPNLFDLLEPFADYLIKNGAKRIVYLSAYGMEAMPELPFHQQMEDKLKASSTDWRIVRPGFFMQNFKNYEYDNITERNMTFVPAGDGRTPFVSAKDVGASIAALLRDDKRTHETHILTGPDTLSYTEAAAMLSHVLSKTVVYPKPDDETYRQALAAAGAPPMIADYMIPVYGLIKRGIVAEKTNNVEQLTGRKPEDLRTVLSRDFGSLN